MIDIPDIEQLDPVDPIVRLLIGVDRYLSARSITTVVGYGAIARNRQDNQGRGGANRVVFTEEDPGALQPPIHVGPRDIMSEDLVSDDDPPVPLRSATTRGLADWKRSLRMYVWAKDPDRPTNELAQLVAVRRLLEKTMRAVCAIGLADVEWGGVTPVPVVERSDGREYQIALTFTHPMFDEPDEIAYPGLNLTKVVRPA